MTTIDIRRKNMLNLFREAPKLGSFDEFPVLRPEVDPQLHVSRNDVDQPFHLICAKDSVIALVSGRAQVSFTTGAVRHFDMEPGDFVYVPAGIPHRLELREPGIQLRYKAREPGLEAVAWLCQGCGEEIHRHVWDTADVLPQEGYLQACQQFNEDEALRRCPSCGEVHPPVALEPFRWADVAETLRGQAAAA